MGTEQAECAGSRCTKPLEWRWSVHTGTAANRITESVHAEFLIHLFSSPLAAEISMLNFLFTSSHHDHHQLMRSNVLGRGLQLQGDREIDHSNSRTYEYTT